MALFGVYWLVRARPIVVGEFGDVRSAGSLQPILQENPALVSSISKIMAERQARASAGKGLNLDDTHPRLLARIASWFGV